MRLLLATSAALALSPVADHPRFAPEADSQVQRTFLEETTWDMESIVQRMDGQEVQMPPLDAEMTLERKLVVTDTYRAVADGRPTTLARTVEAHGIDAELAVNAMGNTEGCEVSYGSSLAGARLVFQWDADAEEHTCAPDEGEELDPALLRGLREDLDLRALLPAEDAEEGDRWTLENEALVDLLRPGGLWPIELERAEGSGQVVPLEDSGLATAVMLSLATDEVEGELELTYGGLLELDGREYAMVGLELNATCEGDSGQLYQQLLESLGANREVDELSSTWTVEGEGSLMWDMAAHRFHTFELNLGTEIEMEVAFEVDGSRIELEGELAGETRLSARCEAAE